MTHEALLNGLPPATISFFAVFSRFEYALKRAGYLRSNSVDAQADWPRLARELGHSFLMRVRASGEVTTLMSGPPKKQVITDGALGWETMPPIGTAKDLFLAVRRVRNNLFHGGKYATRPEPDMSRNESLIREATRLLEIALDARPDLHAIFDDPIFP